MKLLQHIHLLTGWWGRRREARTARWAADTAATLAWLQQLRPEHETQGEKSA